MRESRGRDFQGLTRPLKQGEKKQQKQKKDTRTECLFLYLLQSVFGAAAQRVKGSSFPCERQFLDNSAGSGKNCLVSRQSIVTPLAFMAVSGVKMGCLRSGGMEFQF